MSLMGVFAIVILLLSDVATAASAVLGLDVGTEYIKAALVKPGIPLEIVLTKDSKRKEASAIAFKPADHIAGNNTYFPERLYGGDGLALAPRFPADVYPNLKHLLGASAPFRDAAVREYSARFPGLDISPSTENEGLKFRTKSLGEEAVEFSVEELLAMQLKNIKGNAEAMAGSGHVIRATVITVPPFYTADEKRAIGLAAELAGLEVIGMISDGLAVGLNYGMSRTFRNVDEGQKPEFHLVYDMGAGSTTATILRCRGKSVKDVGKKNKTIQEIAVVGLGWDRTLGGDALNDFIVNDMVEQFVKTSGAKAANLEVSAVKKNGRTMAKLWREAERLRQVLSANSATSASFEGLQEDVDFRYKLSRTEFEALTSSYASRIEAPVTEALAKTNLTMAELDSIILHGGTVRTPFVQSTLDNLTKDSKQLKGNVNADEAAVFGAAFRAAGLSPSFRVKEIRSDDAAGYSMALVWSSGDKERRQNIFVPTSQVGATKHVPFRHLEDFSFSIQQAVPAGNGGETIDRPVLNVQTLNLTSTVSELVKTHGCIRENINVTVSLRLGAMDGIPEIQQGVAACEVDVSQKKAGVADGVKGFFGFGGKKDQKPLQEESSSQSSKVKTTSSKEKKPPFTDEATEPTDVAKPVAEETGPKKKTVSTNLEFKVERIERGHHSPTQLDQINDRLAAFDRSDKGRRLKDELFNVLESLTYRARDMLSDDAFVAVSTAAQRKEIENNLKATGEWLYGEGTRAGYEVVKEKLQGLRGLVNPITKRKEEAANRPKATENLEKLLNQTSSLVRIVKDQVEKAASSASSEAAAAAAAASSSSSEPAPESATTDSESTSTATVAEDDLDDEPTTTTKKGWFSKATPTKDPSQYTETDLNELTTLYESIKAWLAEKLEDQKELAASDDPVLLAADLESKHKQLDKLTTDLIAKRKLKPPPPKSKSSKSKSKKKTESATASSAPIEDESATSAASEPAPTDPVEESATDSGETKDKPRDEL